MDTDGMSELESVALTPELTFWMIGFREEELDSYPCPSVFIRG
jgi:hypothetical protein